nr:DUF3888 domain-containing protein [Priestia taiwanensis]
MPGQVYAAKASYNEAFLSTLFPKMNTMIEKRYGILRQYDCVKILSLTKKYPQAYVYETKVELITYTGNYEPPFERLTFTLNNEEGDWNVVKMNVLKLPNSFTFSCKKPS